MVQVEGPKGTLQSVWHCISLARAIVSVSLQFKSDDVQGYRVCKGKKRPILITRKVRNEQVGVWLA